MAEKNTTTASDFDLRRVATFFRKSLSNKDVDGNIRISDQDQMDGVIGHSETNVTTNSAEDVCLADYIEAYDELNKMFPKLGRLFSFIASDVSDKTHILSQHLSSEIGGKYAFIGGMMEYEKNEAKILNHDNHKYLVDLHQNNHLANGSRTLLRLHRALLFVVEFIDGVRRSSDHDKMTHVARHAYDSTLAAYHPWLIRKGVHVAVYALPFRHQLVADLGGSTVTPEQAEQAMEEIVTTGRAVYNAVQKLYERYELLDLP